MSIESEFRLVQQMYFDAGVEFLNPALVKIIPTSDINALITSLDSMQAQLLMQFLQDPYVDPIEVRMRIFKAGKFKDPEKLINQQPPTPPEIQVQMLMQQNEAKKLDNENIKLQLEIKKLSIEETRANAEVQLKGAQTIKTLRDSDKTEVETDSMMEELEAVVREGQENETVQQGNEGAVPRMEATE
jgi:hypothetical protein